MGVRSDLCQPIQAADPQRGSGHQRGDGRDGLPGGLLIHVDTKEAALALITHLPFNGHLIDTCEVADYAGPAIEQAIDQVVQVTKMENINEHITEVRELVKTHLSDFLRVYGITLNDLKILILPKDERMRELISLQAIGLTPIEAVRYYLALRMAEKGLVINRTRMHADTLLLMWVSPGVIRATTMLSAAAGIEPVVCSADGYLGLAPSGCSEMLDAELHPIVVPRSSHGTDRVVVGCLRLQSVHAHAKNGDGMARV